MRLATPKVAPVEVAGVATRGLPASGRPYLSVLAVKLGRRCLSPRILTL